MRPSSDVTRKPENILSLAPTEINSLQGYRIRIGTRDIKQPISDGSALFAFRLKKKEQAAS